MRHKWIVGGRRAFSVMEYAVATAIMAGLLVLFVAVSTGVLSRSLTATESDLAREDSLDRFVGVVEVEPVSRDLALSPASIPYAYTDEPFTFAFVDRATLPPGTAPETLVWTLGGDPLPVGIAFNPATGVLSGTYTGTATVPVSLEVSVSDGLTTVTQTYAWRASRAGLFLLPGVPDSPVFGQAYSFDPRPFLENPLSLSGLSWSVSAGTLPAGLSLDPSTGVVSGTYTELEGVSAPVTIQVQGGAYTGTQVYTFTALGEGLRLSDAPPFSIAAGAVDPFNAAPLLVRDPAIDAGSLVWTLQPETAGVASAWPVGLSASGSSVVGSYTGLDNVVVDLRATVTSGTFGASRVYVLEIEGTSVALANTAFPTLRANVFYDVAMTDRVSLGAGWANTDVTWSIISGSLPSGVSLNPTTGRVSGTHTGLDDGAASVTIQAALPNGRTSSASYTFGIIGAGAVANPQTLPRAVYGVPYSFDLRTTLTTRNPFDFDTLSWAVSGDPLPAGLSVNTATGLISGTHTQETDANLSILVVASDANNVTAIAVHSLPIKGNSSFMVSAGVANSCGSTILGVGHCWGDTTDGALGNPSYASNRLVPSPIDDTGIGEEIAGMSANNATACAWTVSGAAWCWGVGSLGQLGNGSTASPVTSPSRVVQTSMGPVKKISVGNEHVCALNTQDAVWCWGNGTNGQAGNGGTGNYSSPVAVHTSTGMTGPIVDISVGGTQSCAIDATGQLWCWGTGSSGQLGTGETAFQTRPVLVSTASGMAFPVSKVSAGDVHTCAIDATTSVWCWGTAANGRLGMNTTTNQTSPVKVVDGTMTNSGMVDVSAHATHSCAVKNTGTVWCWGNTSNGRLGNGVTTSTTVFTPAQVTGLPSATSTPMRRLAQGSGGAHSCAWGGPARSWCWGAGDSGRLGTNTAPASQGTALETVWP